MPSNRATDEELVLRCRAGERVAFDELVARYGGAAYNVALRRAHDPEAAADVAQQALLEAYCGLSSLRDPAKFASWLRGITVHLCADECARAAREPQTALNGLEPTAPDPLHELARDEVRQTVREAVARLSRANRLAVNLFYFDGLSCREVADFCGVSVSAVKSRLYEARKALREGNAAMNCQDAVCDAMLPANLAYSGEDTVEVLLWRRPQRKELYSALYPAKARDDSAFWDRWRHTSDLDGLLRLWLYAGILREEGGELIGQVPIYTESDHEVFAAWLARTSQAVLERIKKNDGDLTRLQQDLRCLHEDDDNARFITIVGRLVALGAHVVLDEAVIGPAHDWGGLGHAAIFGTRGRDLPPLGGYSFFESTSGSAHLVTFQLNMRHPGKEALAMYGTEAVIAFVAQLCSAPRPLDGIPATWDSDASVIERTDVWVERLVRAGWLEERDGLVHAALPWLPWSPAEDMRRLQPIAETICEPIADAAEELRVLASQCSFARCRFTDTAYLLTSIALGYVVRDLQREGVVMPYADVVHPGRGAWLYLADETPTPAARE